MTSLSERLRESIRPIHQRIEELPYFEALALRSLPVERYVDQLRGMAIVTAALERALAGVQDPALASVRDATPSRLKSLLDDLAYFDRRGPLPDDPAPAVAALSLARVVARASAERPVLLLGHLYVLQGTTLGNLAHLEDVRACVGGPEGTSWYAGPGGETRAVFRTLCDRLDALERGGASAADGEAAADVVSAAGRAAEALETFHAALDPARRPARRFLATTFNVEAGTHEVPEDPEVVAASLRAGERCLGEFPYFLDRWGERGRRYTRSDVAWLASLSTLETGLATRQVVWLAGVLARRGMPSFLLERQLLLLEEELRGLSSGIAPAILGEAARALASRRDSVLPAAVSAPLGEAFVATAGHGTEAERRQAARLALAAVADEATGFPGAVAALSAWYLDDRFPVCWNGAFDRLLRAAEAEVASNPAEGGGVAG